MTAVSDETGRGLPSVSALLLEAAEHIAMGIRINPMVWRAPITAIVKSDSPTSGALR